LPHATRDWKGLEFSIRGHLSFLHFTKEAEMKTASWIILGVVGTLTLLGSLASLRLAYGSTDDQLGPASLTELSAGRPDVATAVRARRATAAAYGAGFATLFLAITVGPYRRGDVWAWWALLAGMLVVSVLILLRVPFLSINLAAPGAVTGAGTALSTLVQLGVVGLGLTLGAGRLLRTPG
jgi:hypothetical protein